METGAIVPVQSRFHAKFSELQIKLVKQLPQFFNAPQTAETLLPSFPYAPPLVKPIALVFPTWL